VLGGWASLRAQGVRPLDGRTGPSASELVPILLHVGPAGRTRPAPLLDVDRGRRAPDDVLEVGDLLVTPADHACVAIACRYGAEEGLVAADAAVRAGLTSQQQLRERIARTGRSRGLPNARLMAELVDGRAMSTMESRFRFIWVVRAGLPAPEVNPLVLTDTGGVLAAVDLLDVEAAMVGEYDGGHHRELRQHSEDNEREESLERLNLTVVRATSVDIWPHRRHLVARLLDARHDGLGRDRGRDRWAWQSRRL
jgi:hypothetical protein